MAANSSPDEKATLSYPGGSLDLEIVHASEGSDGIALGPLLAGLFVAFWQIFIQEFNVEPGPG